MSMVLPRSIGHNDVIRLGGRDFKVVWHIERTSRSFGFWLYPQDKEPGSTYAGCVWFPQDERIERIKKW